MVILIEAMVDDEPAPPPPLIPSSKRCTSNNDFRSLKLESPHGWSIKLLEGYMVTTVHFD